MTDHTVPIRMPGRGGPDSQDSEGDSSAGRSWRRIVLLVVAVPVLLGLALLVVGYLLVRVPVASATSTAEASIITYADGSEIGRIGKSNRILVDLSQVSDPLQKAVLAAEDRGFYSEPGISLTGIGRALLNNVRGQSTAGGSTITQQYVKNAYLTTERTYTRKVKEAFIALKLSRSVDKNQILQDYLNTVYFGRGADGVQIASLTFFGKDAKDITVPEAAVLAGLLRSPAGYDPARNPADARARWAYVLDGMVEKGWLSPQDRAAATYPTVLPPGAGPAAKNNDRSGPKGYVLAQVEAELGRNGFGEDRLAAGGLEVKTTLHQDAQLAAEKAVADAVPAAKGNADPVAALVSVEPKTGAVWAYVGGREGNGGVDYAAGESRQPGSSFKPYTLATALENGVSLNSRFDGASPQTICGQKVQNDEGDPRLGQTELVQATALSVNTVYYRLACQIGPQKIADLAHRAGIPASVPLVDPGTTTPTAGITLGQYEVHVIDQAVGFATFAAQGQTAAPFFVSDISRGGASVYTARPKTSPAFGADVAADATAAMQAVVTQGTGTRAALSGRPVAGKTGTTEQNKDAWFVGFTPQLATAVWLGRPDRSPLTGVLGSRTGIYGGTIPAGIFAAYMDAALAGQPVMQFPPRANVGRLAAPPTSSYVPSAAPSASASAAPSPPPSPIPVPSSVPSPAPPPAPPPATTRPPTVGPTASPAPTLRITPSPTP